MEGSFLECNDVVSGERENLSNESLEGRCTSMLTLRSCEALPPMDIDTGDFDRARALPQRAETLRFKVPTPGAFLDDMLEPPVEIAVDLVVRRSANESSGLPTATTRPVVDPITV